MPFCASSVKPESLPDGTVEQPVKTRQQSKHKATAILKKIDLVRLFIKHSHKKLMLDVQAEKLHQSLYVYTTLTVFCAQCFFLSIFFCGNWSLSVVEMIDFQFFSNKISAFCGFDYAQPPNYKNSTFDLQIICVMYICYRAA